MNKREKRANLYEQMKSLDADAKGDFNAEQQTQWDTLSNEVDKLAGEIEAEERSEKSKLTRESRMKALEDEMKKPVNLRRQDLGKQETEEERQQSAKKGLTLAYRSWLRDGKAGLTEGELRSLESRALSAGSAVQGGYLVPPEETAMEIIKTINDQVFMRSMATVKTLNKVASLGLPTRTARASNATWTSELAVGPKDTALTYGKRVMSPHKVSKEILISNELVRNSPFSIESEVNDEFAYIFGITQENAFLTGNGIQQPLGIFTPSTDGISTARDVTASSTTAVTGDDLVNALYSLKAFYQGRASWFLHRLLVKMIRKLKDGEGQYLWQMGLQSGQPDRLLGRPVVQSEFAPSTFTTGQYVACLGDFSQYRIVDALEMQMQRLVELYAEQGQIAFIGQLYTDGCPVLEEAFARLILA